MPQGDTDKVRAYATQLVEKERHEGKTRITLRSGDIHRAIGLKNAYPTVGQALNGKTFHDMARVKLVDYYGAKSRNGSDSNFVFEILNPAKRASEYERSVPNYPKRETGILPDPMVRRESKEDIIKKLTERIDELTQDDFENLVRAYAQAKGFSNIELSLVLKLKE